MGLSKLSESFFDPYRKKWVKSRPEELIRAALLNKMVDELDYPRALIAIEKDLKTLPHLSEEEKRRVPPRRIDIVVFAKDLHPHHPLFPLLLIECKAKYLDPSSAHQLIGYNDIVKAPFIALANDTTLLTGRYEQEKGSFHFIEGLFTYKELIKVVS